MKKLQCIVLLLIVVVNLTGCSVINDYYESLGFSDSVINDYYELLGFSDTEEEYQKVMINNSESISVPSGWIITEDDGLMYFSDKPLDEQDVMIYMFQSRSIFTDESMISRFGYDEMIGEEETNKICDSFRALFWTSSEGFSNGPIIGEMVASVNGKKETMKYLSINENACMFYVWGNNVDEYTLKTIAESFPGE